MIKQKKQSEQERISSEYIPVKPEDARMTVEVPVKQLSESQIMHIEKPGKMKKFSKLKPRKIDEGVGIEKIEKVRKSKLKPGEGYTLIITEKPQAALKIASALGNAIKLVENTVPYYELERDNKKIVVACAVGHLFGLKQKKGEKGWPIFNIEWVPGFEKTPWIKKYYNLLAKLVKNANELILATDYDIEGEVIGWNIVRFIAKQQDAKRMKFSSLTVKELEEAYDNVSPTLNWGQAIAGETRHYLDWMYGINFSRALMEAIKSAGSFKIMSIGRVQGPSLNLIVQREREILAFKSEPYWQVFITVEGVELKYNKDITNKNDLVPFQKLKGKQVLVSTEKSEQNIRPPAPFDLTTLQTEAYKFFGITPSRTLQIAQSLYLAGLISYPRTSSQKIPESINPLSIIKKLGKVYDTKLCKNSKPVEGSKSDPAHPSIYPTGEFASLEGEDKKIYDLIVRRFLSCFCEDAIVANKTITALYESYRFVAKGLEVIKKAWMDVYKTKLQEKDLPDLNGSYIIQDSRVEEKETQPPKRYTPASIVRELEKRNLGTKCLTGDTKVMLNGNLISIEERFKDGKNPHKEKDVEIKEINDKTVSLNQENEAIIANSKLISKRKTKENEKVIQIETEGASIKLTENHLVYVFRDNQIKQVPAKQISLSDSLIGIIKRYREGDAIIKEDIFDKRFLRINGELKHKFSAKKNKGIKTSNFPIKWSSSLAWILGYFYGDGSYSDPKYSGSHQVYFTTTEKKALELLKEHINLVFGNEPYSYDLNGKYKVNCNCAMSYALINAFPEMKGKKPLGVPHEFTGDFLRGFFDADGNVHLRPLGKTKIKGVECNSFNTPRVKITLANKVLIEWISKLLHRLEIENNINKNIAMCNGKKFDCWTILISNTKRIEKFAYKIGFETYKEEILYTGLKCASKNYQILRNCAKISILLSKKSMKIEEIIKETNLRRYDLLYALKRLFKFGIITKKRFSQANRYIYSLKEKDIDYINHCMKMVYEKISKGVFKIPIKEVKEINYKGNVYDISAEEDSPNFIIEGNILVHNSTRASIVETLYSRGYIKDQSIQATSIGMALISSLEKHSPIIIDEQLTRKFEKEMESIQEAKKDLLLKEEKILSEAKTTITKISEEFRKQEKEIGKELIEANQTSREQERQANELQICPKCGKGKLRILYNKAMRRYFVACSAYPECKTTFSLPPNSLIKPSRDNEDKQEFCKECQFPLLLAIRKAKRPWKFCYNPECPTRKGYQKSNEENSGN